MNKRIAVAGLIAIAFTLASCGGAADRKAAYMEKGHALLKAENYDKARLEFQNVLQIDPKDVPARLALAETLEKLQDWRGAAGHYLAVIEADPKNKQALSKMGQLYLVGRNVEEAKKMADRLSAIDAKDPEALTLQGSLKAVNKDFDGAMVDVQAAIAAKPGHMNASALLASLYLQKGKPDEAIAALKAVLALDSKNTTIQTILARVYVQLGKPKEAEEILVGLVKQEPQVLAHRIRLSQFYAATKAIDKAEATLKAAVAEITGESKDATTAKLGYIEFLAKYVEGDKAIATLVGMVSASPENKELRSALGKVYEAANKPDKARETYQTIIDREKDPKSPTALSAKTRLAIVMARQGDKAGAKKLVEEVLVDNPRDRDGLLLRGNLALDASDAPAAIADFRAAMKDEPNSAEISRMLARAHLANKEPQLAIDTVKKALEATPTDIALRGDLANIFSAQKDLDSALNQLEEVLKIEPANRSAFEGIFKIRVFQKDWAKAHAVAERMKTAAPKDPSGFYFDGLAFQAENKLAESIDQFESALAVSPDAIQPLSQLIKSHLAMGKKDVAKKRLEEVVEHNPKNFVARNLLGEIELSDKHYPEAQKAFSTALEVNPQWAMLYRNLAATQLGAGQEKEAIATMEKGIDATKGSALLVTALATYLESVGKLDDAVAQYDKILKKEPNSDLAANNLAMLLIEYKADDPAAKARAKTLVDGMRDRTQPAYLDTIGWVAYKHGDFHAAAEMLEKAVQGAPDADIMHYHLGMAYAALGNDVLAKDNLKHAVDGAQPYRGLDEAKATLAKLEAGTK